MIQSKYAKVTKSTVDPVAASLAVLEELGLSDNTVINARSVIFVRYLRSFVPYPENFFSVVLQRVGFIYLCYHGIRFSGSRFRHGMLPSTAPMNSLSPITVIHTVTPHIYPEIPTSTPDLDFIQGDNKIVGRPPQTRQEWLIQKHLNVRERSISMFERRRRSLQQ